MTSYPMDPTQPAIPEAQPTNRATALAEPIERVSLKWITLIALTNLGLFMGYFGPLAVLLPNQIQAVAGSTHKVVAFAWVTGLGALIAMVANPLAGALSDRTIGRFGRRHPWTMGGASTSAVALLLLADQHTIVGIAAAWCLAQSGLNAMQAGVAAGVPDRVPISQRGVVSAWIGIPQTVGVILAVVVVTKVFPGNLGYLALAVPTVVFALPFVLCTSDVRLSRADRQAYERRGLFRSFWPTPFSHRDFAWAWLTRFLIVLGNSMAVLYLLYFLRDRVEYTRLFPGQQAEDGLVILLVVYTGVMAVTTIVAGIISDRNGQRRRPVAAAGIVMAIPGVMLAFWPTWPVSVASAAILGVGFGVYLSVDQALVTQVLPTVEGRAKDLGVISVASSAGQALAPAIAAPLVTHLGGYTALYLCVAGIVLLGSVSVWRVRSVP